MITGGLCISNLFQKWRAFIGNNHGSRSKATCYSKKSCQQVETVCETGFEVSQTFEVFTVIFFIFFMFSQHGSFQINSVLRAKKFARTNLLRKVLRGLVSFVEVSIHQYVSFIIVSCLPANFVNIFMFVLRSASP
jgi:hypothetical protein